MKLDSTNLFLAVIALAMFSVVCVLVLILTCSAEPSQSRECDPDSSIDECPDGFFCSETGSCVENTAVDAAPTEIVCHEHQLMTTCTHCPLPLEERDGLCEAPRASSVCEHAKVTALLDDLAARCRANNITPGQLSGCPRTVLRELVIDRQREILEIAALFSDRSFTIHFDSNRPGPGQIHRWPSPRTRNRFVGALHDFLSAGSAHQGYVLEIALASATGTSELNYELATRRSDAVVALTGEARRNFPTLDTRLRDVELLVGLIGYEKRAALDVATFDEHWGRTGRFLAWDDDATAEFTAALADFRAGTLDARRFQRLTRLINQAVVVIPLPCRPALAGVSEMSGASEPVLVGVAPAFVGQEVRP